MYIMSKVCAGNQYGNIAENYSLNFEFLSVHLAIEEYSFSLGFSLHSFLS